MEIAVQIPDIPTIRGEVIDVVRLIGLRGEIVVVVEHHCLLNARRVNHVVVSHNRWRKPLVGTITHVPVGIGVPPDVEAVSKLIVAVREDPFRAAVMTAVWAEPTVPAVALNVALVEPAGTTTVTGTISEVELSESVTPAPPTPAAWDNTTVQVDAAPEVTLAGVQEIRFTVGNPRTGNRLRMLSERRPQMWPSRSPSDSSRCCPAWP